MLELVVTVELSDEGAVRAPVTRPKSLRLKGLSLLTPATRTSVCFSCLYLAGSI